MAEGLTPDLLAAAGCMGIVCVIVLRRFLPVQLACIIAAIKIAIPLVYFAWFYNANWNVIDDVTYYKVGKVLMDQGYNPFTSLFDGKVLLYLIGLANGPHILYFWWNHLAEYLFGMHYYSPVFMNVALTCVAANYLYRLARHAGFSDRYALGLMVFFLLQWDVLAWSSLLNVKDIMVLALTSAALYHLVRVAVEPKSMTSPWPDRIWLVLFLFVLFWIRFYVPLVLAVSFAIWLGLHTTGRRRVVLLLITGTLVAIIAPAQLARTSAVQIATAPFTLIYNAIRIYLTPTPWSIQQDYAYLQIPSILHWLLLIPALVSGWRLRRYSSVMSLVLIYFILATSLYALSAYLITPRERVEVTFIWAWMQYHFLYVTVRAFAYRSGDAHSRSSVDPAPTGAT